MRHVNPVRQTAFLDTRFRWMGSRGGPDEIRKLVRSRLVE